MTTEEGVILCCWHEEMAVLSGEGDYIDTIYTVTVEGRREDSSEYWISLFYDLFFWGLGTLLLF